MSDLTSDQLATLRTLATGSKQFENSSKTSPSDLAPYKALVALQLVSSSEQGAGGRYTVYTLTPEGRVALAEHAADLFTADDLTPKLRERLESIAEKPGGFMANSTRLADARAQTEFHTLTAMGLCTESESTSRPKIVRFEITDRGQQMLADTAD